MPRIHLAALLPAPDGTGWYAVAGRDRPHHCSVKGCKGTAVAYHHAVHAGEKRIWRNQYRCVDHLPEGMQVIHDRVWMDKMMDVSFV